MLIGISGKIGNGKDTIGEIIQTITIGNLTVEVFFNEYDKSTKKQTQIAGHTLATRDRSAISIGLDDTDFGEFYKFEDDSKIITGNYNLIEGTEEEN